MMNAYKAERRLLPLDTGIMIPGISVESHSSHVNHLLLHLWYAIDYRGLCKQETKQHDCI